MPAERPPCQRGNREEAGPAVDLQPAAMDDLKLHRNRPGDLQPAGRPAQGVYGLVAGQAVVGPGQSCVVRTISPGIDRDESGVWLRSGLLHLPGQRSRRHPPQGLVAQLPHVRVVHRRVHRASQQGHVLMDQQGQTGLFKDRDAAGSRVFVPVWHDRAPRCQARLGQGLPVEQHRETEPADGLAGQERPPVQGLRRPRARLFRRPRPDEP